jgi:ankyrin repeat domain-containing protein 50
MPIKGLPPLLHRKKGNDADDKDPADPPSGLEAKGRSERYGLFFLNKQHFRDVTTAGEARCSVDIVALHGINGDAYNTWTHRNGKLWLRDFLAQQLPGARIFTFGYPSEVALNLATGRLGDYARSLLEELNCVRHTAEVR